MHRDSSSLTSKLLHKHWRTQRDSVRGHWSFAASLTGLHDGMTGRLKYDFAEGSVFFCNFFRNFSVTIRYYKVKQVLPRISDIHTYECVSGGLFAITDVYSFAIRYVKIKLILSRTKSHTLNMAKTVSLPLKYHWKSAVVKSCQFPLGFYKISIRQSRTSWIESRLRSSKFTMILKKLFHIPDVYYGNWVVQMI